MVRDGELSRSSDSEQLQLDLEAEPAGPDRPRGMPPGSLVHTSVAGPDADGWVGRAQALEGDDPVAAARAYERALALDPDHVEARAGLAFALQEAGRPGEAVEHYRRALAAGAADATLAFNLGVALDDLGRDGEAIRSYHRALELDPRLADAHFNLSALYERAGDRAAALRHLISYRELTTGR